MNYHITKTLETTGFEEAIERVTDELAKEGFGVLTEIDVAATLKKKIDVDFRKYRILGACSPRHAYKALSSEGKIGVFLPCNVVVEEKEGGKVEVSAADPKAMMLSVQNRALDEVADEIAGAMKRVIEAV